MHPLLLIGAFVVAALAGYKLVSMSKSVLHTPLMSGMNALLGAAVLCALVATGSALALSSRAIGVAAIALATVNVAGGFLLTGRMLAILKRRKGGSGS